jgi:hypothetical protein
MRKQKKFEGLWWIFGRDAEPHFGVLTYEPENGLNLAVKVTRPSMETMGVVPETVIGSDEHGKKVTLFGCGIPATSSSSGLLTIRVHPLSALAGDEAASWGEARFNYARAEFSLLHNWTGRSRLSLRYSEGLEPQLGIGKPDPIEVDLGTGVRLRLFPTLSISHDAEGIQCKEGHCIEFLLNELSPIGSIYNDYIVRFRRLLTLFTGEAVFDDKIEFSGGGSSGSLVELLQSNSGVTNADRALVHLNMLVSFDDISERFADIVRRWYQIQTQLEDALNLYFSTIFNSTVYSSQQFLLLAQALEVYHRSNPAFGANEKTLAQRLDDILSALPIDASRFIDDAEKFVKCVRATRNHFTHYSTEEDKMDQVAWGVELMEITGQLETLLEVCVFSDLGITGEPIDRLIRELKSRRYFSL